MARLKSASRAGSGLQSQSPSQTLVRFSIPVSKSILLVPRDSDQMRRLSRGGGTHSPARATREFDYEHCSGHRRIRLRRHPCRPATSRRRPRVPADRRRPAGKADVRAMLCEGGGPRPTACPSSPRTSPLTNAGARRLRDATTYCMSPRRFSTSVPKDENEMIVPARDGTLRVLRAAREAGVRRVVITSSLGAIGYGHPPRDKPFDKSDWTDLGGADVRHYVKSKTLAERAAWDLLRGRAAGSNCRSSTPPAFLAPYWGRTSPARSRSSNRCSSAARRRCRGSFRAGRRARRGRTAPAGDARRRRRAGSGSSRSPGRRCRSSTSPKVLRRGTGGGGGPGAGAAGAGLAGAGGRQPDPP